MKYFIKTYGCQMNYSDSERIAGILEAAKYQKTLSEDNADLIIINACSVRQSAINKISGRFKKYKKLRKINPDLKIILTGCVLESDKKKFEKMFDLVVEIKEMEQLSLKLNFLFNDKDLPEFKTSQPLLLGGLNSSPDKGRLGGVFNSAKPQKDSGLNYFQTKPLRQNKISAYVPIMTGCNNFCSYCVVPYTRGREYSRPAEEILSEVENLVEQGYQEIILLGQNVNSYQSKVHKACPREPSGVKSQKSKNMEVTKIVNFPNLLKLINTIPGNFWVRFLTSHPKDMSEDLIKTIAKCEKVTPYIHLALQSGDDEILKKMNRKYTARHFLDLVKMIRKYLPDAAISTDIIIGFPGETEEQFQNTVEIMKKAKFDLAYLNKYSPRPNTAAAELNDNISWAEKKRREKILTEVLRKTALKNNEKYVGKVVEVLVDKADNSFVYGKTESFKNIKIELGIKNRELRVKKGKFVKIKITQVGAWGLEGKVVK